MENHQPNRTEREKGKPKQPKESATNRRIIRTWVGHLLHVLQGQSFQIVGILLGHEKTHEVLTHVGLQFKGAIQQGARHVHHLFERLGQLQRALIGGL